MTPIEFCYWLQGALELGGNKSFSEEQVQVLNEHLKLVFTKVTSPPKAPKLSPGLTPMDGIRNTPWVGPYFTPQTPYRPSDVWCKAEQSPWEKVHSFTPQNATLSDAISQASAKETLLADIKKGTLSLQC